MLLDGDLRGKLEVRCVMNKITTATKNEKKDQKDNKKRFKFVWSAKAGRLAPKKCRSENWGKGDFALALVYKKIGAWTRRIKIDKEVLWIIRKAEGNLAIDEEGRWSRSMSARRTASRRVKPASVAEKANRQRRGWG